MPDLALVCRIVHKLRRGKHSMLRDFIKRYALKCSMAFIAPLTAVTQCPVACTLLLPWPCYASSAHHTAISVYGCVKHMHIYENQLCLTVAVVQSRTSLMSLLASASSLGTAARA